MNRLGSELAGSASDCNAVNPPEWGGNSGDWLHAVAMPSVPMIMANGVRNIVVRPCNLLPAKFSACLKPSDEWLMESLVGMNCLNSRGTLGIGLFDIIPVKIKIGIFPPLDGGQSTTMAKFHRSNRYNRYGRT